MRTTGSKDVLTTGEVARICRVAPRTVTKWFDTGRLRGYRIPGSRDRRIPRQQLLAFMRAYGIPTDAMEGPCCRVLLVDGCDRSDIIDLLNRTQRYDVRQACNGFEAGVLADKFRPHVIVLAGFDTDEAAAICRNVKRMHDLSTVKVLSADETAEQASSREGTADGFDGHLPLPYTAEQLAHAVDEATNLIT